ncbi:MULTISPECIES: hypothetical protein [unclassified Mesorhizobium]|uniref:hypothetical protein n=1 Tax=unclassified Mesorhizobium TaxID=325217 RepID=UPI00167B5555|nr:MULTISPECIES: hypothetical protein [unclassified Mesorhizobium]
MITARQWGKRWLGSTGAVIFVEAIDLPVCGIDQASHPAAECHVFGQNFLRPLNCQFGFADALLCIFEACVLHHRAELHGEVSGGKINLRLRGFRHIRQQAERQRVSMRGRRDLQQPTPGCFCTRLPVSYPAAECKADRKPVVLVQQGRRLLQRVLGSLFALPCDCHFQNPKFNHCAAPFRFAVQSAQAFFVPTTERPRS